MIARTDMTGDGHPELVREFDWYLANRDALSRKYDGRFVVIKGREVLEDFSTYPEAVFAARRSHRIGTYLIQQVSRNATDHVAIVTSPGVMKS